MSSSNEPTVVLVTGANSGVGYATAQVLTSASSASYHVLLAARSAEKGEAAVKEIKSANPNVQLSFVHLDITDASSTAAAARQIESEFGRLDVLINNAGILGVGETLQEQLQDAFNTNVLGTVNAMEAMQPLLLKSKKPYLLNVSTGLASLGMASDASNPMSFYDGVSYRATKSALNMVTVQAHKKLKEKGIKVFAVCPGLVRSNLRGTDEQSVSAGGNAISAETSGEFFKSILEGKRDGDAGLFIHRAGVYTW